MFHGWFLCQYPSARGYHVEGNIILLKNERDWLLTMLDLNEIYPRQQGKYPMQDFSDHMDERIKDLFSFSSLFFDIM